MHSFLLPVHIINIEENPPFGLDAASFFTLFLTWLIIVFLSWASFQIWWHRREKVVETSEEEDNFVVVHLLSHFIQTTGEWIGAWVAGAGCAITLVATIFMGEEGNMLFELIGLGFLQTGVTSILIMPVLGFSTILFSRMGAELLRGIVSIANNTRK